MNKMNDVSEAANTKRQTDPTLTSLSLCSHFRAHHLYTPILKFFAIAWLHFLSSLFLHSQISPTSDQLSQYDQHDTPSLVRKHVVNRSCVSLGE